MDPAALSERRSAATKFLLALFSTEIARDGGASLVTSLKDYTSAVATSTTDTRIPGLAPKRLNALLVEAIQKPRVLAFLEAHPDIFQVDRHATPHWVVLQCWDYVDWSSLVLVQFKTSASSACHLEKLRDKITYALRHRNAKMERRRKRQQEQNEPSVVFAGDTNNCEQAVISDAGVNMAWLLRQCSWDFHEYLRATGTYLSQIYANTASNNNDKKSIPSQPLDDFRVQPVGTRSWEDLVLQNFTSVLLDMANKRKESLVVDTEQQKVWFQDSREEATAIVSSTSTTNAAKNSNSNASSYLQVLSDTLTELVDQDGATQVRLEVLLHRHEKLKRLLGGRDLLDLVQQARTLVNNNNSSNDDEKKNNTPCSFFDKLIITKDGPDIILQSKSNNRAGRMKVDIEGLFSVANGKWGMAMAKIMVRCCKQVGWVSSIKSNSETENDDHTIQAIDLTASVGGMTLGLAKTRFFSQVIGIEIDPDRAELCRQNMTKHMCGISDNNGTVEIRTMDAMEAIPTLPQRSCLVIDPPWGGENYKKKARDAKNDCYPDCVTDFGDQSPSSCRMSSSAQQQLYMGQWTLEDILCKIHQSLRPCLIGLRLPVNFVVDALLTSLKSRIARSANDDEIPAGGPSVQKLLVRKLSVQLFVVLYFSPNEEEE